VRGYSIANPNTAMEMEYLVQAAPLGNASRSTQINDVQVGNHGLI
jgi:hypothetical protein